MHQPIVLDGQIRDFVFIPLIIMVFFIGILRYAGRDLMMNKGKKDPEPLQITKEMLSNDELIEFDKIQEEVTGDEPDNNALVRSQIMRANGHHIPAESMKKRKAYFCKHETGYFRKEKTNNPLQAMMNPEMMTGMLKGQFFMAIYNVGMFSITGFFFSGFVNAKMPFPLAQSFRSMLQQGLTLSNLDVSYVSSLSWCFLCMYGLQGLQNLLTGTGSMQEEMEMMTGGMVGGAPGGQAKGGMPGQPKDFSKIFKAEIENYEILTHKFDLDKAEKNVLSQHRRVKKLRF
mmetsp:Transcript_19997/g.22326  ORF Transcript_19997/g.22326 Transcript_19997/m.22326 type:complete len:287 (-) Transcript_19997:44-904(-)